MPLAEAKASQKSSSPALQLLYTSGVRKQDWGESKKHSEEAEHFQTYVCQVSSCNFKLLHVTGLHFPLELQNSSVGDRIHTILSALQLYKENEAAFSVSFITANLNNKLMCRSAAEKF